MSNIVQLQPAAQTAPGSANGKVPPHRRKNSESRSREYLTQTWDGHAEDCQECGGGNFRRSASFESCLNVHDRNKKIFLSQAHKFNLDKSLLDQLITSSRVY